MSEEIKVCEEAERLLAVIGLNAPRQVIINEIQLLLNQQIQLACLNWRHRDAALQTKIAALEAEVEKALKVKFYAVNLEKELDSLRTQNRQLREVIEEVMSHRREDKDGNYVLWIGEGTFLRCEQALNSTKGEK